MSHLKKLETKLGEKLKEKIGPEPVEALTADDDVATFDWMSILSLLFPLLLDFLEGCLSNRPVDEVSADVNSIGLFGQWALMRKIRQERGIPKELRSKCLSAAVETLEEAPAEEIEAGIREFESKVDDWGLF